MPKPSVTVYIVSHNYGNYLAQSVESVFAQSRTDWELIIIDDGSTDDTSTVAAQFEARDPQRVRTVSHQQSAGLQVRANEALRLARGQYVIRLDADDYFDENALLVLGHYLDTHHDVALVYPSYVYVDEKGNHLGVEHRWRIGEDTVVLDQPAHGACTMVRRRVLKAIGGYDEDHDRQDGHELWLKVVNRFTVAAVTTPLFYYRQHERSLSADRSELLATRARIKRAIVERNAGPVGPRIVGVVGAKNTYELMPNVVLRPLAGRPLIDYTLEAALASKTIDHLVVSTDDPAVVDYCQSHYPDVIGRLRSAELSSSHASELQVLDEATAALEADDIWPDIVVSLSVHAPLRRPEHIRKAVDTLLLYDVDSVVSVYEDQALYYVHGPRGLEPLNPAMHRQIRVEREAIYAGNGVVRVLWRDAIAPADGFDPRVGHIVMSRWDSFQIKSREDAWLVEQVLLAKARSPSLDPAEWDNESG